MQRSDQLPAIPQINHVSHRGGLNQPLEQSSGDDEWTEAVRLCKDIYTSRDVKGIHPPRYFLSNADIEAAVRIVLPKYGIQTIRAFHADVVRRDLLGKKIRWTMNCIDEDIFLFLRGDLPPDESDYGLKEINEHLDYLEIIQKKIDEIPF